jgi:4-amino-4-deoxy-L-arabinose transferase-like glycosyltransferase
LIALVIPWTGFLFLGAIQLYRDKTERGMLSLILFLLPIALMLCFKQKVERYLLPMLAPASVISAAGFVRGLPELERARRWIVAFTWGALLMLAVGVPFIAAIFLRPVNGTASWSLQSAAAASGVGLAIVAVAWIPRSIRQQSLIPVGVVVMMLSYAVFLRAYAGTRQGQSASKVVADVIAERFPANTQIWYFSSPGRFSRVPIDMDIYLNRTLRKAEVPATLPVASGPQLIMVHRRSNESLPPPLNEWHIVGTFEENGGTWSACVQPRR